MLLVECRNLKKSYGDRLILDIENLCIYDQDRIGIVGVNGAGKTTLLNLLSQRIEPDEGWVKLFEMFLYFPTRAPEEKQYSKRWLQNLKFPNLSGEYERGEKNRFKLAASLEVKIMLLFSLMNPLVIWI